jgi:hypothetical protein
MKLAIYNHYNPATQTLDPNQTEKNAYILIDIIPPDYTDIDNITNVHSYGDLAGMDFQQRGAHITILCSTLGFNTLSNAEKDIVGIYSAIDDSTMITHYATTQTGGDVVAAMGVHSTVMGKFVTSMQEVANARLDDPCVNTSVMNYMKDRSQIDLFMDNLRNFISDYKFKFHLGTVYGDSTDGIMDYIENTGSFTGVGTGLDAYEFSDIHKQVWYDANAANPSIPTQAEQDLAHAHVRDLLKVSLVNKLRDGLEQ